MTSSWQCHTLWVFIPKSAILGFVSITLRMYRSMCFDASCHVLRWYICSIIYLWVFSHTILSCESLAFMHRMPLSINFCHYAQFNEHRLFLHKITYQVCVFHLTFPLQCWTALCHKSGLLSIFSFRLRMALPFDILCHGWTTLFLGYWSFSENLRLFGSFILWVMSNFKSIN